MKPDREWYKNPKLLLAAKEEFGSLKAAAREIGGVDATTLTRWWAIHRLPTLSPGPAPGVPENQEALEALYKRVYG